MKMNLYEKGLDAARCGDWHEALTCLRRHLNDAPEDARAWNDAGVVLFTLGRLNEAIESLERAKDLECEPTCVDYNLFCACIAAKKPQEALDRFEAMLSSGLVDEDKLHEAVSMLLQHSEHAAAAELLVRAGKWLPGRHLDDLLQQVRLRRPKIAFFCGGDGDTFLRDICDFVRQRFDVRVFDGDQVQQVRQLMEWSDISWFEWCTNLAEIGSKMPRLCRNIIRLHRYEAYTDWPQRINWANIDALVTVGNPCVDELVKHHIAKPPAPTRLMNIPNGVNLDKVRFLRRKQGKNIAFVGNLRLVKNPMFALQCMKNLCQLDPAFRLFIAGRPQDLEVQQYMRHMVDQLDLSANVFFDGWQTDLQAWLADKHYILSTSVIESQGMAVLEAMAAGLKPVVHNFPGADGIYPPQAIFNTPDDFCRIVLSGDYAPAASRDFVRCRYALPAQLQRIERLFDDLQQRHLNARTPPPTADSPPRRIIDDCLVKR